MYELNVSLVEMEVDTDFSKEMGFCSALMLHKIMSKQEPNLMYSYLGIAPKYRTRLNVCAVFTFHHCSLFETFKLSFPVMKVINTSYERPVKAARLQLKVSCDQPEKRARKDPLSPAIIRLFLPEDDDDDIGGVPTCAPGEIISPVFISDYFQLFSNMKLYASRICEENSSVFVSLFVCLIISSTAVLQCRVFFSWCNLSATVAKCFICLFIHSGKWKYQILSCCSGDGFDFLTKLGPVSHIC